MEDNKGLWEDTIEAFGKPSIVVLGGIFGGISSVGVIGGRVDNIKNISKEDIKDAVGMILGGSGIGLGLFSISFIYDKIKNM